MHSKDGRIQAPLGRRDSTDQAEHILVSFDTFLDRRTAVVFGVTAAGVRIDRYHSSDQEDSFDSGFDPVWRAETQRVRRSVDRRAVDPVLAAALQSAHRSDVGPQPLSLPADARRSRLLDHDSAHRPRVVVALRRRQRHQRRRAAAPHRGAAVRRRRLDRSSGDRDRGNPFDDGKNLEGRVGADIKMGLGPNLTLETAINPDFGQVEADPAEVNLTAFETRFPEKRPFFVEGAQLFNIGHPNFYYSRRIGARPIGPATGDYVEYPEPEHDPRRRQADRPPAVEDVARFHRRGDRRRRGADRHDGDRRSAHGEGVAARLPLRRPHAAGVRTVRLDRRLHRQLHASRFRRGQPARRSLHAQCDRGGRQHAAAIQGRPVRVSRLGRRLVPERRARSPSSAGSDRARTTRSGPIATTRRSIRR